MLWSHTSQGWLSPAKSSYLWYINNLKTIDGDAVPEHRTDGSSRNANVYFDQKSIFSNRSTLSHYDVMDIRASRNVKAGKELFKSNGISFVFELRGLTVDTTVLSNHLIKSQFSIGRYLSETCMSIGGIITTWKLSQVYHVKVVVH